MSAHEHDENLRAAKLIRVADVPFITEAFPAARDADQLMVAGASDTRGRSLIGLIVHPVAEHGSTPLVIMLEADVGRELAEQLTDTAEWCDRG